MNLDKLKSLGLKLQKKMLGISRYSIVKIIAIPGLIDSRVFVGEPGFEYKENYRTLSEAALSGGVTSVVTMPNTDPVIDNVSTLILLKEEQEINL